jgi:hypothetical protein
VVSCPHRKKPQHEITENDKKNLFMVPNKFTIDTSRHAHKESPNGYEVIATRHWTLQQKSILRRSPRAEPFATSSSLASTAFTLLAPPRSQIEDRKFQLPATTQILQLTNL